MPLAWDVRVGTLEIVDPPVPAERRVLADYQKVPASVCMWSGPTVPNGVVAEVVLPSGSLANSDLKGKLVLVVFWRTTCAPCLEHLPDLKRLADRYRDRGLVVRPICVDEPDPEVVFCPLDPHPLPLSCRHEGDGGMHYDGDYHARERTAGADVDVCFGGRIAVARL